MPSLRSSTLLFLLALALLAASALAGALPIGAERAVAADETGEETTTTPEEPPPVVETPAETETTTPETETPAPPVTTPPVGAVGGEGGGVTIEAPKSTSPAGSQAGGGGGSTGGGSVSGGGGSSSGSTGSTSTGTTTTTTPTPAPSRHTSRPDTHRSAPTRNVDRGSSDSTTAGGGGGSRNSGGGGGGSARSHSGSAPAPQPTVSPPAFDQGASAVTDAASHVGDAFAEALPTAPLKKIGDRLAAHIAGVDRDQGGAGRKQSADGIGAALGAALIGSAVAVERTPAASSGPIPFFDPPGGESGTIYLVLIALLLLGVGALVVREARSSLGFASPRYRLDRWFSHFRRLRASAAAGLRSLF